jgi:hypothetical protein
VLRMSDDDDTRTVLADAVNLLHEVARDYTLAAAKELDTAQILLHLVRSGAAASEAGSAEGAARGADRAMVKHGKLLTKARHCREAADELTRVAGRVQ